MTLGRSAAKQQTHRGILIVVVVPFSVSPTGNTGSDPERAAFSSGLRLTHSLRQKLGTGRVEANEPRPHTAYDRPVVRVVASVFVLSLSALVLLVAVAAAASPAQVILKAHDLPGWRAGAAQPYPSRDIIQHSVDATYPRGSRPLDGYIASFFSTKMALNVYVAQTANAAAARMAVRHFRAASAGQRLQAVALGNGGWYGESAGLSTGSGVVWSSGAFVLGISLHTLAPKAGLAKAQIVALARIMQGRAG